MIGSTNLVLLKLLKWNLNHNLFLHQKGYCWRCFLRKDALLRSYTLEKAIRLSLGWIFWITSNIFKRFEGKVLSQFCVKCYDCYREESQLPGPGAWILPAAEGGAGAGAGDKMSYPGGPGAEHGGVPGVMDTDTESMYRVQQPFSHHR